MAKDDVEILGTIRPGGGDPPPPKKKSKKRKGWMIVVGLLVIASMIFFVHRATTTKKPVPLPAMAPPLQKPGTVVSNNPEYRKKLAQQNALAARTAEKSGSSVLPTLGADTGNKDSLNELTTLEKSKKVSPPPPPDPEIERERREEAEARRRIRAAKIKSEDAAVTGEMRTVLSTWATQGEGLAVIAVAKSTRSAPGVGSSGSPAPKGTSAAAKKKVPIIPAGKILYGVVVNTLDSDNPGPVLVQAVGGRFDGTKFLGSFQRNHGKLTIQLNRVIYPDGESDSIGAYVVSPGAKLRAGLETDVDHHYLYRYGGLLASAFLQGFGEAAMYSNSTAYPSAYGMPIIGFNGMTFLQQSELGMGQAGMMLGSQAMNAFNRPTTVKLAANTPVGILIVAETGQKLPKEPAPAAAVPARSPAAPAAPVPSMVPQPGYPMTPMSPYGGYVMPMMPMMP